MAPRDAEHDVHVFQKFVGIGPVRDRVEDADLPETASVLHMVDDGARVVLEVASANRLAVIPYLMVVPVGQRCSMD